jgi:hypothetical protein
MFVLTWTVSTLSPIDSTSLQNHHGCHSLLHADDSAGILLACQVGDAHAGMLLETVLGAPIT